EGQYARLPDLAAELVRLKVDVIMMGATVAVSAKCAPATGTSSRSAKPAWSTAPPCVRVIQALNSQRKFYFATRHPGENRRDERNVPNPPPRRPCDARGDRAARGQNPAHLCGLGGRPRNPST